jgi:hypothetical protein
MAKRGRFPSAEAVPNNVFRFPWIEPHLFPLSFAFVHARFCTTKSESTLALIVGLIASASLFCLLPFALSFWKSLPTSYTRLAAMTSSSHASSPTPRPKLAGILHQMNKVGELITSD